MKVSEYLRDPTKHPSFNPTVGLCSNFRRAMDIGPITQMSMAGIKYSDWPLFSGDSHYPVPYKDKDPHDVYVSDLKKWSKHSVYGRSRWKLCHWLAAEFEKRGL